MEGVTAFSSSIGGTATNVAVAAARLGRRVGRDHEGRRRPVRRATLRGASRDSASTRGYVGATPRPADPGRVRRARPARGAAASGLPLPEGARHDARAADLDPAAIRAAAIFWVTGTGLSDEPSLATTMEALAAARPPRPRPCSTSTGGRCSGPIRRPRATRYRRGARGM